MYKNIYIYTYTYTHIHMDTHTHIHIYIYTYMIPFHFERKMEAQRISLVHLPFAHRANGNFSLIRLLTKKLTEH